MTTDLAEKPKKRALRRNYTDQEIEIALTALAICSGQRRRAAELVKETHDLEIPPETIRDWRKHTHTDRYERIRQEIAPQLEAQLADAHQALADNAAKLEAKTIERPDERLKAGDVEDKDLANILKNSAIAGGIHVEKARLLNDRPTQIVKKELPEVLRALKGKGLDVEVIEAEVVEEKPTAEIGSAHGA